MKQLLFALLLLNQMTLAAQTNISNTSTIPVAVTDAFLKKFPNNAEPKWSPSTYTTPNATTVYVVEFKTTMSDRKNEVWIDKDGNIVMHRKFVDPGELPEEVKSSIARTFPNFATTRAERVEENGRTNYLIEIKHGSRVKTIKMDGKGEQQL